ncbi:hypothetical protein PGIGA_G00195980 [Pangasianodon gigas]|uniref:Uncharacterized protein n=1 Tax=Pangasianodon gigas TaxID=30993 RepID=A0ACC5XWW0_PANGG|nr:hypothetical protein [Pangasianodon gigas]
MKGKPDLCDSVPFLRIQPLKFFISVIEHFYLHLLSLICYSRDKTHTSIPFHGQIRSFIRKLRSTFLKPVAFKMTSLETVDLLGQENQLPDLQLGPTTDNKRHCEKAA